MSAIAKADRIRLPRCFRQDARFLRHHHRLQLVVTNRYGNAETQCPRENVSVAHGTILTQRRSYPESVVRSAIVATGTNNNRGVRKNRYCELRRPGFQPGLASPIKNPCPAALSIPVAAVFSKYMWTIFMDQIKCAGAAGLRCRRSQQGSRIDRSGCPDLRTRVGIHPLAPKTTAKIR